jgi:hypothetical protein
VSLLGPRDEDIRKIHAEVNQLVNQRFVLTTLAITAFGVVMAILVPRTSPVAGEKVAGFVFLLTTVLSLLLFSLFLLSHLLRGMLRVFTTYLKVTGTSNWEADWGRYRCSRYLGYTKPQTLIFLMLNGLAIAFPFFIVWTYQLHGAPRIVWIACLAVGGLTELLMIGMGLCDWWDQERQAEQQWKALKFD